MRTELDADPKTLVLISDDSLDSFVKKELEKGGFQTERLLYRLLSCQLVILDYHYLQSGIVNYLKVKKIEKPIVLVLTETQMRFTPVPPGLFHDILVLREGEYGSETRVVISAMDGETDLQAVFEKYLSKQSSAYAETAGSERK